MSLNDLMTSLKARGNWGHGGRPGKRGGSTPGKDFGITSNRVQIGDSNAKAIRGLTAARISKMDRGEFIRSWSKPEVRNNMKRSFSEAEKKNGGPLSDKQEGTLKKYLVGLITHDEASKDLGFELD